MTGLGTFVGAAGHSLPFLISPYQTAFALALVVVVMFFTLIGYLNKVVRPKYPSRRAR